MGILDRWLNRPPNQDDFAAMLIKRIRRSGDTQSIVYERDQFRLRKSDNAVSFLHNLYQEYLRLTKPEREQLVRNFLAMWHTTGRSLPQDFADVRGDILPALRARSYFELDLQRANDGKFWQPPPYETVADHLAVSLVYDLPTAMRTVSDEELSEWGVSFYEAMEIARKNLEDKPTQIAEIGSIYAFTNGDAYDATRMILLDFVQTLKVDGETIVMVPNRERLYVVGSEDAVGLETVLKFLQEDVQHERFISGMAFRLEDDQWHPWLPEEEHPLYPQFKQQYVQTIGQMYSQQEDLLNFQHQQTGKDVYVASFSGRQDESSEVLKSFCVWTDGIDSLLPHSDEVFFVRPVDGKANILTRGPWDLVCRLTGDLMEPQGTYPERWRVKSFPEQRVLDQFIPWHEQEKAVG